MLHDTWYVKHSICSYQQFACVCSAAQCSAMQCGAVHHDSTAALFHYLVVKTNIHAGLLKLINKCPNKEILSHHCHPTVQVIKYLLAVLTTYHWSSVKKLFIHTIHTH